MLSPTSVLVTLVALAAAHMEMKFPIPLGDRRGLAGAPDSDLHAPLMASGADFPCKGKLNILATPAGASLHTWTAGADANITIGGVVGPGERAAFHNGGSCQVALSYDQGKTWKVIHSFQGNCPVEATTNFSFVVPSDAPSSDALLAWIWFNHTGNREMYMNCASITIAPGSGPAPAVPFAQRPDIFRANIGNGCATIEGIDTFFPNPGPDVTNVGTKKDGGYVGNCGVAAGPSSSPPTVPVAPVEIPARPIAPDNHVGAPIAASTSAIADVPTPAKGPASASPGLRVSTNGECSGEQTCAGSTFGRCCSTWGYCGDTPEHCGARCMSAFGECDVVPYSIRGRRWMTKE